MPFFCLGGKLQSTASTYSTAAPTAASLHKLPCAKLLVRGQHNDVCLIILQAVLTRDAHLPAGKYAYVVHVL